MSVLRPLLSRRGRLVFVATALLLVGALVAAPGVSGAKAAVKQFTATISPTTAVGGVSGPWALQVTNCGFPVASPCTASSTIGLGTIRIAVPTEFRPVTVSITAPPGRNWAVSYDSATGNINAGGATGSDKLQPGEAVSITINATPAACAPGTKTFTTAAWGSASVPGTDPFGIQPPGSQPTVTLAGSASCLESGDSITDPATGQTETIDGNFQGHVNVTFGGDTGPDCGGPEFGTLGDQWQVYHLPTQVTITPAPDFVAGTEDKISTSEFPLVTPPGGDSSWYLICFAVPIDGAHPTAFATRGGGTAINQSIGGVPHWVGILASCVDAPTPCVSEQFLTTGPGGPPWSPGANKVHIAIRMKPGDPYKK
jgi:hypothetical protein